MWWQDRGAWINPVYPLCQIPPWLMATAETNFEVIIKKQQGAAGGVAPQKHVGIEGNLPNLTSKIRISRWRQCSRKWVANCHKTGEEEEDSSQVRSKILMDLFCLPHMQRQVDMFQYKRQISLGGILSVPSNFLKCCAYQCFWLFQKLGKVSYSLSYWLTSHIILVTNLVDLCCSRCLVLIFVLSNY